MNALARRHDAIVAAGLARARTPGTLWARPSQTPATGIPLGYGPNNQLVHAPLDLLRRHLIAIGKSGFGKTNWLTFLAQGLLTAAVTGGASAGLPLGVTVVVLDAKNDLAEALRAFAAYLRLDPADVVHLDPADEGGVVTLNPLDAGTGDIETHARSVLQNLRSLVKEDTNSSRVWLDAWGVPALAALIAAGATLLELAEFVSIADGTFRGAVLELIRDDLHPLSVSRWRDLAYMRPNEAEARMSAVSTRAGIVAMSPVLRRVFGSAETSFPLERFFYEPGPMLALASLGRSPRLSEYESRAVGLALVQAISQAAWERRERLGDHAPKKPVFVISDEAERFVSRDVADGYEKLRSLGVHFISSYQFAAQLGKTDDPYVAASVLTNSAVKVAFNASVEDAEMYAKAAFTGHVDLQKVKHEMYATRQRPNVVMRTSTTRSGSSSWDEGNLSDRRVSESFSESATPAVEMEEYQEKSSVQFYSVDEQLTEMVGSILRQPVGTCSVSLGGNRPVTLRVPLMKAPPVSRRAVEALWAASRDLYGRPVEAVDAELRTRVAEMIESAERARRARETPRIGAAPVVDAEIVENPVAADPFADPIFADEEEVP